MQKVIIIGVDGATLDLLEPWMDAGKLPTFDKIRKKGTYGTLYSTTPCYSAPAWVSIVTGCNPGKHGIYDFFRTDSFSKRLVSSRYRKAPAIWNYLTDIGKKSIIVNVPGTYPPEKIDGVMITGLLTPSPESEFTHPKKIKDDLVDGKLGNYELEQVAVDDLPKNLYAQYAPEKLVEKVNTLTISHTTVALNLMKTHDWDLSMVVIRGTDDAQHLLWDKKDLILSCYQKADEYIGKIMKEFPDAFVIIVSDHGFDKPQKYLYANNVLYNTGYLKTLSDPNYNLNNLMMTVFDKISRLLFHLFPMEKLARSSFGRKLILSGDGSKNIDFSQTKALYHSVCSRGIRILLKDKYEQGIVSKEEYEKLREELIKMFLELKDSKTGEKIIKTVHRWEDIYGKNAVNDPLDLILDLEPRYGVQEYLRSPEGLRHALQSKNKPLSYLSPPGFYDWMGDHAPEGIIFMYGKDLKANKRISASVMDIVPTALAVLNIPISDFIDGAVIEDAFSRPPIYKKVSRGTLLSKTEMKRIKDLQSKL